MAHKISLKALVMAVALIPAFGTVAHAETPNTSLWENVRKAGKLRCGAAVIPPYVSLDASTKEYGGFFSALCKEFAETVLKVKPEFVDTNWDNIVAGLQSDKWDLAMALNQTPTRGLAVTFSEAVVDYEISFAYNAKNPKLQGAAKSLTDFDKKDVTFIVISGTAMDKSLSAAIKNGTIMRLSGVDETRLALMSRRGDVLVDTSDSNRLYNLKNKDWVTTVTPEPGLSKQGVAFGLPRNTSYADIEVLNIFLREKKALGQVDALVTQASEDFLKQSQ